MRFVDTSSIQRRIFAGRNEGGSLTIELDSSGGAPRVSLIVERQFVSDSVSARFELDADDVAKLIDLVDASCPFRYQDVRPAKIEHEDAERSLRIYGDSMSDPFRYGFTVDYVEKNSGRYADAYLEDDVGREILAMLRDVQPQSAAA